jgi:hypothetical protein
MTEFNIFLRLPPPKDVKAFLTNILPLMTVPLSFLRQDFQVLRLLRNDDASISELAARSLLAVAGGASDKKRQLAEAGILMDINRELLRNPLHPHIVDFACRIIPPLHIQIVRYYGWRPSFINKHCVTHPRLRKCIKSAIDGLGHSDWTMLRLKVIPAVTVPSSDLFDEENAIICMPRIMRDIIHPLDLRLLMRLLVHPNARLRQSSQPAFIYAVQWTHNWRPFKNNMIHFMRLLNELYESLVDHDVEFVAAVLNEMDIDGLLLQPDDNMCRLILFIAYKAVDRPERLLNLISRPLIRLSECVTLF